MNRNIKCSVCGDNAIGINYSAITCACCRTFFMRNSTKTEKLKCFKNNQCQIDIATRKSCPLCRLKKCVLIGMKVKGSSPSVLTKDNDSSSPANEFLYDHIVKMHSMSHQITEKAPTLVETFAIKQSRKRIYAIDLSENERHFIYELQNAMSMFVDERTLPETRESSDVDDLILWPKFYARKIIKFSKNIQAFKLLNSDDQLQLLKSFYLQLLLIRAMFNYDVNREGYPVIENEYGTRSLFIKLQKSELYKCDQNLHNFTGNFACSLKTEMENDTTIRDLLICQYLFRSTSGLTECEFVRKQYFVYCHLLKCYLQAKYKNVQQATKKFINLINMLKTVDDAMEKNRFAMSNLEVSKFEHFLVELYGLVQ